MNEYVAKPIREEELYRIIQVFTGKTGPPEWLVNHTPAHNNRDTAATLINLQYLQGISKGDRAFERTMLQQFIAQLPEDLSLLKAAITAADIPAIRSIAHNIKTTVAFIGLEHPLYAYLDPMERLSDDAAYDAVQTAAYFDALKQLCLQAVEEAVEIITD